MNCNCTEHMLLSRKMNEAYAGIELPKKAEERLVAMVVAHEKRLGRILRLAACMALGASFAVFAAQSGLVGVALDAVLGSEPAKAPAVRATGYVVGARSGENAVADSSVPGGGMMSVQNVSPVVSAANASGAFVWTGAEDSCWTNAANWTVGGDDVHVFSRAAARLRRRESRIFRGRADGDGNGRSAFGD